MSTNRRQFIKATAAGAVAASLPLGAHAEGHESEWRPLEILILGGTGFIGPHMVREALRRGHGVTLFNRGRTNNTLFPDLETIIGDRSNDLTGLEGRKWDVVIDNSGYMHHDVRASASLLAPNVEHYVFISSISAYESMAAPMYEDSPLAALEDESVTEFDWSIYGALKAVSERIVGEEMGEDRTTVLRPTYIVGPGDHTDRFTYWPVRVRQGGRMLCPGSPEHPIQVIDVRDLANFTVDVVERRTAGVFNTTTPIGSYTMHQMLEDSQAVAATTVEPVWVGDEFVMQQQLMGALPIYHPISGDYSHASSASSERARAAGLHNRPVRETIRDLLTWWDTLPAERHANTRFRMTPEREAELLAEWETLG